MKNKSLRTLVETSLFATLIFISVYALRIPVGAQFIHFGNALVVVGVLLFGSKRGALAAAIGLGMFDLLTGYASVVWITILESLVVCLVLHLTYERIMKADDKPVNIIAAGIIAAVTKIILNLFKYTLTGVLVVNLDVASSFVAAIAKITGTFGSALVTVISVPILYPILKNMMKK
ncbi:hypothetical protein D3X11_01625 [Streptococcus sp. X16XC17]|uniref:ECF transporter S component n=1 Tax=Streptococcus sp. X16XC17 TaxID=2316646 RepID=UPI00103E10B7|nr:ECF transporter S component [Streptococcus sp. X16XC17]TCD46182.1 hypothetical protein D3X11_01625 [Streptococcus sp. X16XC17]